MTSLIINLPHLQSRRQRYGATFLSLLCWAWFMMPLVIVGGWLMGFHVLAQEVVWLGGWQSLLRLAEIAATIIVSLAGVWTLWTLAEIRGERRVHAAPVNAVSYFGVDPQAVITAKAARVTTVYFTETGAIAGIVPGSGGAGFPAQRRAA
jgi:poly-beta-1,6-N-acetyl-D-glucosamine biosynthesis protein PgaD